MAFAVVDKYQGQGIGTALMRHLSSLAYEASLQEFVAEVLPENSGNVEGVREKRPSPQQAARDADVTCHTQVDVSSPIRLAAHNPINLRRFRSRTCHGLRLFSICWSEFFRNKLPAAQ